VKLHQLRSLIAVAARGSIHEASRELHVSQPAVSKALADLEANLGVPLLVRSSRGVQLTTYGQSLIRHARAIEQELRHAHDDIETLLGIAKGTVSIGVTPVTSSGPFAHALKEFLQKYPQVNVNVLDLRPTQILEGLSDGSLDFGLVSRIGEPDDARFFWEPLLTIPTALAVRTKHPLRGRHSLEDLTQYAWVSWDALDDRSSLIGTLFSDYAIDPPKSVLRCTSATLYMEMATSTDLISVWSELPFHLPALGAELRKIPLKQPLRKMTIGLVGRDINLATTIATAFLGMIRRACLHIAGSYRKAGAVPFRLAHTS
jgi:DNA-binding transcriptional LysR family regulator